MDAYPAALTLGSTSGTQPPSVVNPPEQPKVSVQPTTDSAQLSPESQLNPKATEHDAVVAKVKAALDPKTPPPAEYDPCASRVDALVNSVTKPESTGDFVQNAFQLFTGGWFWLPAAIISDANRPAECSKPKETTQPSPPTPSEAPPEGTAAPQPIDLALMAKKGSKAYWSTDPDEGRDEIGMEVLSQLDTAAEGKNPALKLGLAAAKGAESNFTFGYAISLTLEAVEKREDTTDSHLGALGCRIINITGRKDGTNVGQAMAGYLAENHPDPDVRAKAMTALEESKKVDDYRAYDILRTFFGSLGRS